MWEISVKNLKIWKTGYLLTIPKFMNYTGYQAFIPKKYVTRKDFFRYINLPDSQKLKIKKDDDVKIVTIFNIKNYKKELIK